MERRDWPRRTPRVRGGARTDSGFRAPKPSSSHHNWPPPAPPSLTSRPGSCTGVRFQLWFQNCLSESPGKCPLMELNSEDFVCCLKTPSSPGHAWTRKTRDGGRRGIPWRAGVRRWVSGGRLWKECHRWGGISGTRSQIAQVH